MNQKVRDQVREFARLSGARLMAVDFIKKDGSERRMIFNPKVRFYIKGEAASPSAQQAVETRKENHPELYNVWDAMKREARSINLDTVIRVKVAGQVWQRNGNDEFVLA